MRYTNVFEINDYREACKFLQDKYDALGFERFNYYNKKADGTLSKNSKVGHGNDGLQYHHICEDIVPSLSSRERAEANLYEYQQAENMCYANLLEHAWLHILITENNSQVADNSQDDITGIGGVQWMLLALNSIMCNADTSWYSSKNEEGKGCSYNVNNIITDNKDLWLKVVNRFCTSAFIRQRLGKTPQELATLICLSCKKDGTQGGSLLSVYSDILAEANSTKLFDWNVNAYADLENFLRDNQSALVYICTGGGKTTTGLEYLRVHGGKALALGSGNTIKDSWTGNTNVEPMNYQSFMNDYENMDWSKYSVVICDEAHHVKAERWGEGIRWLLENKPEIKIIGLTATPTKEQFDGTDTEFGGRICYGLDLATGIKEGNIWPFDYISSIYKMEDVKDEFEQAGLKGRVLWDRLNIKLNETPVTEILHRHMPEGQRKIIVFCSSIKDIQYAEEVMNKYDPTLECRVITSKQDIKQNNDAKKWFNETTDKNVCLITVSMVNEGAHYNGVNTLIMFRRTHSATLYLQQLGRVVVTTKKPNPNGIVFDFTNNAENLIYNSTVQVEVTSDDISEAEVTEDEKEDIIKKVKKVIKDLSGTEVIHEDYTEDCVATLNTLREAQNVNKQSAVIYSAFDDLKKALETEEQDFFYYDLWANLETATGNLSITRPKHATSKKTSDTFDEALAGKRSVTKKIVKASEVEKLATAFRTAIRRLYNFGYIEFADMRSFDITILNKSKFNETIKALGFKNAKLFEDVMNKLNKHSLIIASNI